MHLIRLSLYSMVLQCNFLVHFFVKVVVDCILLKLIRNKTFLSSDPEKITKVGEGTFGEAFMVGNYVCKIVPIDGDFRVNGEVQKVL